MVVNLDEYFGAHRRKQERARRVRRIGLVLWVLALGLIASAGCGAILRLITDSMPR